MDPTGTPDRSGSVTSTLGVQQGRFGIPSPEAAAALVSGTVSAAMAFAAGGGAPRTYDVAVATVVLRGLGLSAEASAAVAGRPLPPLPSAP